MKFDGPLIPFGALVNFLPSNPDDKEAVHPMGSKTIPGVFAGYHQAVGGLWSGDLFIVPLRTIKEYNQAKPHCRRISAGDVYVEKKTGVDKYPERGFIFPVTKIHENYGE